MALMVKKIGLEFGERTIAALTADPSGTITIEHDLTAGDLDPVLTVEPVDESNQPLSIVAGNIRTGVDVVFQDAAGAERLGVGYDKYGYLEVVDPKGIAGLQTALAGSGSAGDQPIRPGSLTLRLGPFHRARVYCDRILQLYEQIDLWLKNTSLIARRSEHTLVEELLGTYKTFLLEIDDPNGARVTTLQPVGASVIGAEGRVEIFGRVGREGIVYFVAGGPQITVKVGAGPSAKRVSRPVFKGVEHEGWYWLESARLSRVRPLDEALFKDLLRGVADYYELSAP
jgi:hypothetical protein